MSCTNSARPLCVNIAGSVTVPLAPRSPCVLTIMKILSDPNPAIFQVTQSSLKCTKILLTSLTMTLALKSDYDYGYGYGYGYGWYTFGYLVRYPLGKVSVSPR